MSHDDAQGHDENRRYRSIFISDVHLGTRGCKAEYLLDFLKHNESEQLYLIGDMIDVWRLKRRWYWTQPHNDVIQKLLRKARKGTRIVFVPGNHDENFRAYDGLNFGGIEIRRDCIHETADGRRLLVIHGDEFDTVVTCARWLALLGDHTYEWALWLNDKVAWWRRHLGYPYWSLSSHLKHKVKNAVSFICRFEEALADEARRRNADGVVCGHIHHPEIRDIGGITYCNSGDWVESCSAMIEHADGRMEIVRWAHVSGLPEVADESAGDEQLPHDKVRELIEAAA